MFCYLMLFNALYVIIKLRDHYGKKILMKHEYDTI